MNECDMELWLDTTLLFQLLKESRLVLGDGTKGSLQNIENIVLWQSDGNVLQWLLFLLRNLNWLMWLVLVKFSI